MKRKWTISDLANSKVAHLNPHLLAKSEKPTILRKPSKEKAWLEVNLSYWAQERGLTLEHEYKFDQDRKWRFDWAFPSLKIAIEYNGIMSKKSRHTTVTGYSKDMEKVNAAQKNGWRVLQYTPLNYKEVINDLIEILCK